MSKRTKYRVLSSLAFFVIFFTIWTILHVTVKGLDVGYKGMISGGLTAILAPRIKKINTQSGDKIQIKWIFLKKPISV